MEWFMKAADQGSFAAQFNIDSMYRNGQGVPQDNQKAMEWYLKAAEQGNTNSENDIGFMYRIGMEWNGIRRLPSKETSIPRTTLALCIRMEWVFLGTARKPWSGIRRPLAKDIPMHK